MTSEVKLLFQRRVKAGPGLGRRLSGRQGGGASSHPDAGIPLAHPTLSLRLQELGLPILGLLWTGARQACSSSSRTALSFCSVSHPQRCLFSRGVDYLFKLPFFPCISFHVCVHVFGAEGGGCHGCRCRWQGVGAAPGGSPGAA